MKETMELWNVVSVRVLIHPTRDGAEAESFIVGAEDSLAICLADI